MGKGTPSFGKHRTISIYAASGAAATPTTSRSRNALHAAIRGPKIQQPSWRWKSWNGKVRKDLKIGHMKVKTARMGRHIKKNKRA